jgi:predicted membrane chloride channel (bestrophin family)
MPIVGRLAIPAVGLAAFTFTSVMESSEETEDPFGYDYKT